MSLVDLAAGGLGDDDMMDVFLTAAGQGALNDMRTNFEALPAQFQEAEFGLLPSQAQQNLLDLGYQPPWIQTEKEKFDALPFWKKALTQPLPAIIPIPDQWLERTFGVAATVGLAGPRLVGHGIGKSVSALWHGGTAGMRWAEHVYRTMNYVGDVIDSPSILSSQMLLGDPTSGGTLEDRMARGDMGNPSRGWSRSLWGEAWNETEINEDSYTQEALDRAKDLVGEDEVERLRLFLHEGSTGIAQTYLDAGMSEAEAKESFFGWYDSLGLDPEMNEALTILNGQRNTSGLGALRTWNRASGQNVSPDSVRGQVIATASSIGATILLDPVTYSPGAIKNVRTVMRGVYKGKNLNDLVNHARRGQAALRAAQKHGIRVQDVTAADLGIGERVALGLDDSRYVLAEPLMGAEYLATWAEKSGGGWLARIPMVQRAALRNQQRYIERVTNAFKIQDEIDEVVRSIRSERALAGLEGFSEAQMMEAVAERTGGAVSGGAFQLLINAHPATAKALDLMREWHQLRKSTLMGITEEGSFVRAVMDESATGLLETRKVTDMSTMEGFFEFLVADQGQAAFATQWGGITPQGMLLPQMTFGNVVKGKLLKPIDDIILNPYDPTGWDLGRMADETAEAIAGNRNFVIGNIKTAIEDGGITLSKKYASSDIAQVLNDFSLSREAGLARAEAIGMVHSDRMILNKAFLKFQETAPAMVRADGEMSVLGTWYQAGGYHVTSDGLKWIKGFNPLKGPLRARENFLRRQLHNSGSVNSERILAERSWGKVLEDKAVKGIKRVGNELGGAAVGAMYYPAAFAKSLLTYVPKTNHLDVMTKETAITDFNAYVEMGALADMPREVMNYYKRAFIMGNEGQRIQASMGLLMDMAGRSGLLLHGGDDITQFLDKFVRNAEAKYSLLQSDFLGLQGMNTKRGIFPSAFQEGHMSALNVMPNYRELAALTRRISYARTMGHGIHLPSIDKFFAMWWRPMVLLRLGYVARNGGEELFTWLLREGPLPHLKARLAKGSLGYAPVYDEFGMKSLAALEQGDDVARHATLMRPVIALQRSFNEVIGAGDNALAVKAIREAYKNNTSRWGFLNDAERVELFESTLFELHQRGGNLFTHASVGLFNVSERLSLGVGKLLHKSATTLHIPTKQVIARRLLRSIDSDYIARIESIQNSLTIPTIMDSHMKNVLSTFDNYMDFGGNGVRDLIGASGGAGINKLPLNYKRAGFAHVSMDDLDTFDKTRVATQHLDKVAENQKFLLGAVEELHQFVPKHFEDALRPFADELVSLLPKAKQAQYAEQGAAATTIDILRSRFAPAYRDIKEGLYFNARQEIDTIVERAIGYLPPKQQEMLRGLLLGSETSSQNYNMVAMLFSDIDVSRITHVLDDAVEAAQRVTARSLRTAEGQDASKSMISANTSMSGGEISHPLPPGQMRTFYPMVPQEYADEIIRMLSISGASSGESRIFFEEFVQRLNVSLSERGYPQIAEKIARLLRPSGIDDTATNYMRVAAEWQDTGMGYMPLAVGSTDPVMAELIAKTFDDMDAFRIAGPEQMQLITPNKGRIGARVTSDQEFTNNPLSGVAERQGRNPVYSTTRGGITETAADIESIALPTTNHMFYGLDSRGMVPAVDFGPQGLRDELVYGTNSYSLGRDSGLTPLEIMDGTPRVHAVDVYHNKDTGWPLVVRRGSEDQYPGFIPEEWDLVSSTQTTGNDLYNFSEESGTILSQELLHMFSSSSRSIDNVEVFYPWLQEIRQAAHAGDVVDEARVGWHTTDSGWWGKSPKTLIGSKPIVPQGGKIEEARQALLSYWFDGVVNPMIGAMVREPLFHHYLYLATKQTEGMRTLYNHQVGRFDDLVESLGGKYLGFAGYADEGQVVIPIMRDVIRLDWPMAMANADSPMSKFLFALDGAESPQIRRSIQNLLKADSAEVYMTKELDEFLSLLGKQNDETLVSFARWAKGRKVQNTRHNEVATQRAMTLTGAYIDDHRIRSQFQEMVGTLMPFWFAEDQFLRRMGRSLSYNPRMFRDLNLGMQAGTYGGIVAEDKNGNDVLVYPGSEIVTNAILGAGNIPVIGHAFQAVFGSPLGSVVKDGTLSSSINIIPGYDKESAGSMGFGPLLAIPLLWAGQRDPSIRTTFEHNLIGGRFGSRAGYDSNALLEIVWSSVAPALVVRSLNTLGITGTGSSDRSESPRAKAMMDVIMLRFMNDELITEEELAAHPDPEMLMEEFLMKVDEEAKQLQFLQSLTWFVAPASMNIAELTVKNDAWEWNQEFYDLVDQGLPWEEAYRMWRNRIIAVEGEFDPFEYSPFRVGKSSKIPFAVLESTETANEWLSSNEEFIMNHRYSGGFFMPRGFGDDDDEFMAEARGRQLAYGLRQTKTPSEFLQGIFFNNGYSQWSRTRNTYLTTRYQMKAAGDNTTRLDNIWAEWDRSFSNTHPVYAGHLASGDSGDRRKKTLDEMRLLLQTPDIIPEGEHKNDILSMMTTIVAMSDELEALTILGRAIPTTDQRNEVKIRYYERVRAFAKNKPWLNELYYSMFMPLLNDTWIAKYDAGLIELNQSIGENRG